MKFTFGIITASDHGNIGKDVQHERIQTIISSIEDDLPPLTYEIIVLGDYNIENDKEHVSYLDFTDRHKRQKWITRQKNLITQYARHDNIVYMHDYFRLYPGWYNGFLKFGNNWDVCMNVIINTDNTRYRDWCIWDDPDYGPPWVQYEPFCPEGKYRAGTNRIAAYDYNKTQYMYISGGYWIAKRQFMLDNPLDERLCWGDAEDVEWSDRIREFAIYKMNTYSAVQLLRYKSPVLKPTCSYYMTNEYIVKKLI